MIYLTGVTNDAVRAIAHEHPIGVLNQPDSSFGAENVAAHRWWAADNACFAKGDSFDPERWLVWLSRQNPTGCLFAVAPDVVGDAAATWERSAPYLAVIRELGFPPALVAQDGFDLSAVDWDAFDVLFIGGTTEFKIGLGGMRAVAEGKRRGKWVHMGRVNSYRRLALAVGWGCDSADGTFLAFAPDVNLPRMLRWLDKLNARPQLFGATA